MRIRVVVFVSAPSEEVPVVEDLWRRLGLPVSPRPMFHNFNATVWRDSYEFELLTDFVKEHEHSITYRFREERVYTPGELAGFEFLRVTVTAYAGFGAENFGPVYDKSSACPACGLSGWRQTSPLIINKREMGKKDLAITYSFEYLSSDRLKLALEANGIGGYCLMPVRHKTDTLGTNEPRIWQITSAHILPPMVPPTVLERSAAYCETCDRTGVYLKSEPYYSPKGFIAEDINFTAECFGERPFATHDVVISQRTYRLLRELKVRNFRVEPVHLI